MIAIDNQHPSDEELIDFGFGRVPAHRFEQLLHHLDSCDRCQQRVEQSHLDDSFAAVLATSPEASNDPILAEPDCQAAVFHAAESPAMRLDEVLPPVESLGPYRLLRPLGRGGMGAVFLAEHTRLKKKCAIKLLPRGRQFDAVWIGRFEREMQAVAGLSHPGIVGATDAGDVGGWHYLVMEFLDGLDLAAVVRRLGPLEIPVAAATMRNVCDALAAVHDAGLIHRDVKPSNIMLTRDGSVKLLDLGLVLDQSQPIADLRLTTVGHVIGTLAFASPEQLCNTDAIDGRADLYSVGATLYQLIAGHPAHDSAKGIAPLVIDKTNYPADRLKEKCPEVPAALDDLVARLLERDPNKRPASAAEVALQLSEYCDGSSLKTTVKRAMRATDPESATTHSIPVIAPAAADPPRHGRFKRWLAAAGAAAVLAGVIITIESGRQRVRIEMDAPETTVTISESETSAIVENSKPEKLFKGKPLSYWMDIFRIERDVDTLVDAMNAVASLADPGDVEAATAILLSARRYGGWIVSDDKSVPSQLFMGQFRILYKRLMLEPGLTAILGELVAGNSNSRAACLWVLQDAFDSDHALPKFDHAENLHQILKRLIAEDDLELPQSIATAKALSLKLALALEKPLQQEPGLREDIEEAIVEAESGRTIEQRLKDPFPNGKSDFAYRIDFSIDQFIAAKRLNIDLPDTLEVRMLLDHLQAYREIRNEMFLDRLRNDPQTTSDEALLWLYTASPYGSGKSSAVLFPTNEKLWSQTLPTMAKNTTSPKLAWANVIDIQNGIRNGLLLATGYDSVNESSKEALREAAKIASQRIEDGGSEDPFTTGAKPHPSGGGMF